MNEPILSATKVDMEAAVAATKLRQKADKQAVIRMMASNIYGHLHGDKIKSQLYEDELVVRSVDTALAIWSEVERRV